MERIPVVIIAARKHDRSAPLLQSLESSSIFEVVRLSATIGTELRPPDWLSTTQEHIRFGRSLTQNERACAISHSRARTIIKDSSVGGVILEDDARILDLAQFEKTVSEFLDSKLPQKKILSLLQYHDERNISLSKKEKNRIFRLPGSFPLAVAYALTPNAAEELISQSNSTSGVSDWPDSACAYFFLRFGLVRHGDKNTKSIIGQVEIRTSRFFDTINNILTYSEPRMLPANFSKIIKWKIYGKIAQVMIKSRQQKNENPAIH